MLSHADILIAVFLHQPSLELKRVHSLCAITMLHYVLCWGFLTLTLSPSESIFYNPVGLPTIQALA